MYNDGYYGGLHLSEIGEKMHHWHAGQWDPIYMVGSYFVMGDKYPDYNVVERAHSELSRQLMRDNIDDESREELHELLDALTEYLKENSPSSTRINGFSEGVGTGFGFVAGSVLATGLLATAAYFIFKDSVQEAAQQAVQGAVQAAKPKT